MAGTSCCPNSVEIVLLPFVDAHDTRRNQVEEGVCLP